MKLPSVFAAALLTGSVALSANDARAASCCQYVDYPANCIVRPGVVLRPGSVAGVTARDSVCLETLTNHGGPVDHAGSR